MKRVRARTIRSHLARRRAGVLLAGVLLAAPVACRVARADDHLPHETLHLGFDSENELLEDFVSQLARYRSAAGAGLAERRLAIVPGRFGNCLHIQDGSPISKGTWNESGLDCDLIVAVLWGEWHRQPHYWGAGAFHGRRGTVAFWVKTDSLRPGVVFLQGSVGWGRKQRDLLSVEVDADGRLHAHLRDVRSQTHRVLAREPAWRTGRWQPSLAATRPAYLTQRQAPLYYIEATAKEKGS